jgi:RNA polymerase sigma-70 factor, ECF subfamily
VNAIGCMDDTRLDLATLAEDCRCGKLSAYERLYQAQGSRMKSVAYHLLGSIPDAEDAVQEAFLRIYRNIAGFREEANFATWIYRILVNICHDQRRRKQRRPEAPVVEIRAAGAAPSLTLALEQALGMLNERHRLVFLLFEAEGFAHAEIAGILDTSESNSRYLLHEAKRELREILGSGS